MERTKETIRRCFIIINVIIVGIFVYLILNENNLTKEKLNEKDKITKEYQVLMNDTSISEKEIEEVNKSIDELEHIDETVKTIKEEVFKLASSKRILIIKRIIVNLFDFFSFSCFSFFFIFHLFLQ